MYVPMCQRFSALHSLPLISSKYCTKFAKLASKLVFFVASEKHILNSLVSFFKAAAELKKKRTFRKFTYRGVDLDQLLDMNNEQLMELFPCRVRRKISRGLKRKPMALIKKLRKKKKECPVNEKPDVVKTHLRDMIIVPEMTGSVVGVYNGKTFNQVEIKVGSEI